MSNCANKHSKELEKKNFDWPEFSIRVLENHVISNSRFECTVGCPTWGSVARDGFRDTPIALKSDSAGWTTYGTASGYPLNWPNRELLSCHKQRPTSSENKRLSLPQVFFMTFGLFMIQRDNWQPTFTPVSESEAPIIQHFQSPWVLFQVSIVLLERGFNEQFWNITAIRRHAVRSNHFGNSLFILP
ncbi:MAG: hypothetical protein JNK38_18540 [Acidobacteria bacterium]|nr:hypothetical protein [Acidobacteriota bacterium]